MNRPDTHTRTGTHTHMDNNKKIKKTCKKNQGMPAIPVWAARMRMGSPYAYGLRKMAHMRMGQPIRVREKYAYGTEHYMNLRKHRATLASLKSMR